MLFILKNVGAFFFLHSPPPLLKTLLLEKCSQLYFFSSAFSLDQTEKNLPAMQETQVRSLGWDNPLEKRMAIHSSILTWKIPWTEESGGLESTGLQSQT